MSGQGNQPHSVEEIDRKSVNHTSVRSRGDKIVVWQAVPWITREGSTGLPPSVVPRPSKPPVFDPLQYTKTGVGGGRPGESSLEN